MILTDADVERVAYWIKVRVTACPLCRGPELAIGRALVNLQDEPGTAFARTRPCVALTCKRCAFVALLDAAACGVAVRLDAGEVAVETAAPAEASKDEEGGEHG